MRYVILMLGLAAATLQAAEIPPAPLPELTESETFVRSPAVRDVPIARTFRFQPQADITTDELARLQPYLKGRALYAEDLKDLGTAARHLREVQ